MNYRAIIFDCDGTLADTMPAHYLAWSHILRRHELTLSEDRFYELGGWPTARILEMLAGETGRALDVQSLAWEKETRFVQSLHTIRAIEPVVAVVHEVRGKMPIAVATGAVRSICEAILERIGLAGVFDALVCSDDVTHHKPDPEVFLEAARRLNVAPVECLVYEDTDPGLEAAHRAGMTTIDVRSFYRPRRVTPLEPA